MNYAPIIRIVLRYAFGGAFFGSPLIGEQLASDPDVVMAISFGISAVSAAGSTAVEWLYYQAKKRGWKL